MIPAGRGYRRIERQDTELRVIHAEVADRTSEAAVLIAPTLIGVCRSDLRELAKQRHLRRDFGHEIVARVVAARPHTLVPVGQRVVYDPHPTVERTCGFGELVEMFGAAESLRAALVPVDDVVPAPAAVFAEPLACAVHCVRRLETASRELALPVEAPTAVLGAGMAGTLIAAVLHERGVPVRLLNRSPGRIEFLRHRQFLPAASLEPAGARRFPRVILATAAATPQALHHAAELVEPGGLLLLFAGTDPTTALQGTPLDGVRRRERLVTLHRAGGPLHVAGTHGALTDDFHVSLALLDPTHPAGLARRLQTLITQRLTLTEAAVVLPRHLESGFGGKAVVQPCA
ncbi:MAG TPA: alcohol dehydrogenase catalytic domain-containing protein [Pilimelia sp.]|nr:alcohol dehydrogenase catalytic domain-containing protein [Pilimelia sp.]